MKPARAMSTGKVVLITGASSGFGLHGAVWRIPQGRWLLADDITARMF